MERLRNSKDVLKNNLGITSYRLSILDILIFFYQKSNNFNFVQIGANDGVSFDYLYEFVTKYPCSGIVIEPIKLYFYKLVENYKNYPLIVPLNIALHRTNNKVPIFYVNPNKLERYPEWSAGLGSFNFSHFKKHDIADQDVISENVECITFDHLVLSNNLENIDYLQIDTEGYDAEILRMIDFKRIVINLIRYESIHMRERDKMEMKHRLEGNGYSVFSGFMDTFAIKKNILSEYFAQQDAKR